jgi:hypothetical protein
MAMSFGVSPTRNAVVIAHATGSGETFSIKSQGAAGAGAAAFTVGNA